MYIKSVILPFEQSKEDERGYIKSIINQPSTNTSIIMCKPGSVRANHYHPEVPFEGSEAPAPPL